MRGSALIRMAVLSVPAGFLEPELIRKGHTAGVRVMLLLGGDFPAIETGAGVLDTLLANLSTFNSLFHRYDVPGSDVIVGQRFQIAVLNPETLRRRYRSHRFSTRKAGNRVGVLSGR